MIKTIAGAPGKQSTNIAMTDEEISQLHIPSQEEISNPPPSLEERISILEEKINELMEKK